MPAAEFVAAGPLVTQGEPAAYDRPSGFMVRDLHA